MSAASKSAAPVTSVKLQLYKSPIGYSTRQRATVHALGLRRLNQVVVQTDTAAIRGMLAKVQHLVRVVGEDA
jgi:large subunit ribosomal protein L30